LHHEKYSFHIKLESVGAMLQLQLFGIQLYRCFLRIHTIFIVE